MVDKKISELTAYTTPIDTDVIAIVDVTAPATKKITWSDIKTSLNIPISILKYESLVSTGDWQLAINAAIDEVSLAGGGIVFIPEGEYIISASIVLKSNVILEGTGTISCIKHGFTSIGKKMIVSDGTLLENVIVRNLKIDRTGLYGEHGILIYNAKHVKFENISVIGDADSLGGALGISPWAGLLTTSEDITVTNCYFEYGGNFGVQFGNVIKGKILNNTFIDCFREVIGVEPITGYVAENIIISGNIISTGDVVVNGTKTGLLILTASSGGTVTNVIVSNNEIEEYGAGANGHTGIYISGNCNEVSVISNIIRNTYFQGIVFATFGGGSPNHINVKDNIVLNCSRGTGYPGIAARYVKNSIFTGNTVLGANHTYGILESETASGNIFVNNKLVGNILPNLILPLSINKDGIVGSGTNLLLNPEFQDCNADNLPDFWTLAGTPTLVLAADTLFPALGGNQVTITGTGAKEGMVASDFTVVKPLTEYVYSIDYKANAGDSLRIEIYSRNGATTGTLHVTTTPYSTTPARLNYTFTTDADANNLAIYLRTIDTAVATVSHPKLEEGSVATPYTPPDRNKVWVSSIVSSATPTPVLMARKTQLNITALSDATATFGIPTSTPGAIAGDVLIIRIKDDGTARTLAWNAIYRAGDFALPLTTVLSKTMYLGFIYNGADTKWDFTSFGNNY